MKQIKLFLVGLVSLTIFSCSDDFLETESSQQISSNRIDAVREYYPDILDGYLAGTYVIMFDPGTGGTTAHTDIGHRGYDIYSDMLSTDMVLGGVNYGHYSDIANLSSMIDFASMPNYRVWSYYYRIVFSANAAIDALGGTDVVPATEEEKWAMGQAKAMRAFGYFYLTQFEQEEYDPSEVLLPLYTSVSTAESQVPMSEIYNLIVSDLTTSIDYLSTFDREYKYQVNEWVAKGLLAYTYAAMGDWANAYTQANDIAMNAPYSIIEGDELTGGFNDVSSNGWIWGTDITEDMGLNLVSWYGQMDVFTYSYAWAGDVKGMDVDLYNAIPTNDERKAQFSVSGSQYIPNNKFYNPDRTRGGSSSDNNTMDYLYMRISEFYLLGAEAAYMSGNEARAKELLKALVEKRVPDASYIDDLSGERLLNEISLQERIEFFAEGKSYLLMKRQKQSRTRGANHLFFAGDTFEYNDPRMTFLIPQSEIQNNPFID